MTETIKADSRALALAVHATLRDLDPARMRDDMKASMAERLTALAGRAGSIRDAAAAHHAGLTDRLHHLAETLPHRSEQTDWVEVRQRLHDAYDGLWAELRTLDVHVPTVRPSNHARSVYHMVSSSGPLIETKFAEHSDATALAIIVFPQPGGP